ncbi:uncharacterized protein LOC109827270 [Asparagus officinalis]|uniref:uncharacterized protein LOC109827270 n=1 Tax=Asparagus officinalis TaxID=4686 RepID=UPI00098DE530|nr:uncharacterized protein LOC109827270 [Asparagus officinalis]
MLESSNPPDAAAAVKRYAPPSQRNRSLNRRKSSEKFEKVNYPHGIEGEKGQGSYSRNFPAIDHGEAGINNIQKETARPRLIPLNGCSSSEASQLLNERWAAVLNSHNDPSVDLSERPLMYSGASGSSWGHLKLPHQVTQMDFLGELRRAVQNGPMSAVPPSGEQN